jgi:PKD repeat protein
MLAAQPASAAPVSNQQPVPVTSSSLDLGGFVIAGPIVLPDPLPLVFQNLTFTANATWTGDMTTNVGWDGDSVRQGAKLPISRVAPVNSGNIAVTWQVSGTIDGIGFGPDSFSQSSINCAPTLSGGGFSCSGSSGEITLPGAIPSPIPFTLIEAKLGIGVNFDVTPQNAVVNREFTVGGADVPGPSANPGPVALADTPNSETFTLPCTSAVGAPVNYNLSNYNWTPATTATQQTRIRIINTTPIGGEAFQYGGNINIGPAEVSNPAFDLTGTGFLTAMGPLLANNVTPTIDPLGPFSGTEGSPVQFSASTHSQCPIASYVWQFSDGTTSYGATPQKAFGDEGTYTGQLTVTDVTGLSAVQDFTVNVADTPPVPNAGPATSGDWGVPIAFNGQTVEPGWVDQPTVSYAWDWGDGTPGTGGASASHTYAKPGVYTATLTVCDEDPSCAQSTTTVTVNERAPTLSYTGVNASDVTDPAALSASLIDDQGDPVVGRTVNFFADGSPTPFASAATNGMGVASTTFPFPTGSVGPHTILAQFAGDGFYTGSQFTQAFTVNKDGTILKYTGPTSTSPSKALPLSATLTDDMGRGISGETVSFSLGLGLQDCSATTNGLGVASCTISKVTEKPGNYTLTTSFGGDANYIASTTSTALTVGK